MGWGCDAMWGLKRWCLGQNDLTKNKAGNCICGICFGDLICQFKNLVVYKFLTPTMLHLWSVLHVIMMRIMIMINLTIFPPHMCGWLFVSTCQPCDELITCPGCNPPSHQDTKIGSGSLLIKSMNSISFHYFFPIQMNICSVGSTTTAYKPPSQFISHQFYNQVATSGSNRGHSWSLAQHIFFKGVLHYTRVGSYLAKKKKLPKKQAFSCLIPSGFLHSVGLSGRWERSLWQSTLPDTAQSRSVDHWQTRSGSGTTEEAPLHCYERSSAFG